MGQALYNAYPEARQVFHLCDSLRPGTIGQCFSGTPEELQETRNTQPCLFAMELAAAAVLRSHRICPDALAGFSLGELAAATAAGLFDLETGFRLVCRRGQLMQAAAQQQDTSMAAVVKLSAQQVKELCTDFPEIYPVNFNCPGNTTVSGLASQMPAFCAAVKAAGGRALPLKVKGAFHSPYMHSAAEAFRRNLSEISFADPNLLLYSNVTAAPYGSDPAGLLSRQISSPVQWESLIRNMLAQGVDTFLEIGPGKTLSNMIRKIDPAAKTYSICELSTLLQEVHPC